MTSKIANIYKILEERKNATREAFRECKERLRKKYNTDWVDSYTAEEQEEFETKRVVSRNAYNAWLDFDNLYFTTDTSKTITDPKKIPTDELVKEILSRDEARLIVKCFPKDSGVIQRGVAFVDNHFYKNDMLIAINTVAEHD